MKERPILFNGEMVRAILAGRKTQTRRAVKPQPVEGCWMGGPRNGVWDERTGMAWFGQTWRCPCGVSGDCLWVRETWCSDPEPSQPERVCYRATAGDESFIRWKPAIHMPRWASRITLEIAEVRVQRLQDISEEDARAEGVENVYCARDCFADLWDSINGKRAPWSSNPWVWAISFRKVEP